MVAAFLLIEYGVWPYKEPLFELPQEIGAQILAVLTREVSCATSAVQSMDQQMRFNVKPE